jgi:hypothetical protein
MYLLLCRNGRAPSSVNQAHLSFSSGQNNGPDGSFIAQRNPDSAGNHDRTKQREIKRRPFNVRLNGPFTLGKRLPLPSDQTRLVQMFHPDQPRMNSELD